MVGLAVGEAVGEAVFTTHLPPIAQEPARHRHLEVEPRKPLFTHLALRELLQDKTRHVPPVSLLHWAFESASEELFVSRKFSSSSSPLCGAPVMETHLPPIAHLPAPHTHLLFTHDALRELLQEKTRHVPPVFLLH
jgi:hypothetical protein